MSLGLIHPKIVLHNFTAILQDKKFKTFLANFPYDDIVYVIHFVEIYSFQENKMASKVLTRTTSRYNLSELNVQSFLD